MVRQLLLQSMIIAGLNLFVSQATFAVMIVAKQGSNSDLFAYRVCEKNETGCQQFGDMNNEHQNLKIDSKLSLSVDKLRIFHRYSNNRNSISILLTTQSANDFSMYSKSNVHKWLALVSNDKIIFSGPLQATINDGRIELMTGLNSSFDDSVKTCLAISSSCQIENNSTVVGIREKWNQFVVKMKKIFEDKSLLSN